MAAKSAKDAKSMPIKFDLAFLAANQPARRRRRSVPRRSGDSGTMAAAPALKSGRSIPLVILLAALVAGCTCDLSGTPLDTVEKTLNPACWSCGNDEAPPPSTTAAPTD